MALWLALVGAAAACSLASGGLVGVAPADLDKYPSSGPFKCADGSGEFPAGAVNDDFCDCADGSDEPGTAACAGRPGAHFYCRNEGSVPKLLYASRVRDGICDCCDGSDEAAGRCQNACEAEGAQVRADRDRRRAALVDGLRVLKEAEDKAKVAAASWQEELEALDKEMSELNAAVADAKARVAEAKKAVDDATEARKKEVAGAIEAEEATNLAFSEDFEDDAAEERWRRAVGGGFRIVDDPKGQRGKVLATTSCTWGGDAFSDKRFGCSLHNKCFVSFWARGAPWQGFSRGKKRTEEPKEDAHSWLAVPAESLDFPDRLASTRSSDDWVFYEYEFPQQDSFQMLGEELRVSDVKLHVMVQAHDSTGRCGDTMFDDFKIRKDDRVAFLDADGDKVEFKFNDVGEVSAWANDEEMALNMEDLKFDGNYLLFGGFRALAPNRAVVRRAMALWARRQAANGNPPPQMPPDEEEQEEASAKPSEEASAAAEAPPPAEEAPQAAEAPKAPEISEYAKWALDQESGSKEGEATPGEEASSKEEEAKPSSEDSDDEEKAEGTSGVNWNRVVNRNSPGVSPEMQEALRKAEEAMEDAKSKKREKKEKQEELSKKLKQVQENPRFFTLSDECVKKRIQQYNYDICFTAEAKQGHVSLGRFKEWESGSPPALLFASGQHCHGGPARSLRVKLLCGSEGVLNDVSEPSRCSYEAEVVHPVGCREEDLQALEEQVSSRVLRPHEEL